jgi:uncharacterized protein (TIGR02217 family)
MTFYEIQFPKDIGNNAVGGPMRVTDVVSLRSGFEEANAIWADSRRKWDVSYGIKSLDDLHTVIKFWEAMNGRLHTFRFSDPADMKSCAPLQTPAFDDQIIGTGDGTKVAFQLSKAYGVGVAASYHRTIKKPVPGTIKVGVNGVEVTSGWVADTTKGIITFSVAPVVGNLVTAGFEYDVPVRFASDNLSTNVELYRAGTTTIEVMEIKT